MDFRKAKMVVKTTVGTGKLLVNISGNQMARNNQPLTSRAQTNNNRGANGRRLNEYEKHYMDNG